MERDPSPSAPDSPSDSKKSEKKNVRVPLGAVVNTEAAKAAEPPRAEAARPQTLGELFSERKSEAKADSPKEPAKNEQSASEDSAEKTEQKADEVSVAEVTTEMAEAAPDDRLSAEERREAASQLVEARTVDVQDEQTQAKPGSPEAEAASQASAFLAGVGEQVKQGVDPEAAADAAYQEVTGEAPSVMPAEAARTEDEVAAANPPLPPEQLAAPDYDPNAPPDDDGTATGAPYAPGGAGGGSGWGGRAATGMAGWAGGFGRGVRPAINMAPNAAAGLSRAERAGAVGSGLLVGGIVGYLLGRRRGRIRTERELLPVQRKLEREVQQLSNRLAVREAQVRQHTWERTAAEAPLAAAAVAAPEAAPANTRVEAPAKPSIEAPVAAKAEAARQTPKTAEQLHIDEVLKISETIVIGSTTIRKVFETNLVSERGLRRIVETHLRGGDTRKVLTEELLIKEMAPELDPQLRDRPIEAEQLARGAAEQAASMVPGATLPPDVSAASFADAAAAPPEPSIEHDGSHIAPALVVANIVALVVLAGLLMTLLVVWLLHS